MVRYCAVLGRKKVFVNSLDKARRTAIGYIHEEGQKEVRIYQGTPGKVPVYGIVGFDVGRYEYYFIRGGKVYFLNWLTGATVLGLA